MYIENFFVTISFCDFVEAKTMYHSQFEMHQTDIKNSNVKLSTYVLSSKSIDDFLHVLNCYKVDLKIKNKKHWSNSKT